MFGPAKLPADLVAKIRDGVDAVLSADRSVEHLKGNSCERMNATPQQFHDLIVGDAKYWRGVIEMVGIRPE
jgi:tripartite-type tricarboxylate transporter receptor subunit TctC